MTANFYTGNVATWKGVAIGIIEKWLDRVVEVIWISDWLMSWSTLDPHPCRSSHASRHKWAVQMKKRKDFWDNLDVNYRDLHCTWWMFHRCWWPKWICWSSERQQCASTQRTRSWWSEQWWMPYPEMHGGTKPCFPIHSFTFFATYTSSGQTTITDYWLLWRHNLKLATDPKVTLSTNIAPHHHLLILDLQINLTHRMKSGMTEVESVK